jgi:elongation factor P
VLADSSFAVGVDHKRSPVMATTSDLSNGMVLRYNNELYRVVEWQHVSPGNWRAFVRVRLKNLKNGRVIEERLRAGEDIDVVRMEFHPAQYLYKDGDTFYFMEDETYEQVEVPADMMGDSVQFLRENDHAGLVYSDGQLTGVEIPTFVTLAVTSTIIAVRGDTATNVEKPATLETGAVVNVPAFVKEGDMIKIDTRTGKYLERVNK